MHEPFNRLCIIWFIPQRKLSDNVMLASQLIKGYGRKKFNPKMHDKNRYEEGIRLHRMDILVVYDA